MPNQPESISKTLRMEFMEKWIISGLTQSQIAEKVGVSLPTIKRYMAQRNKQFRATISERQIAVFNFLVRTSIEDFEALGQLIDQIEPSMVMTDAYGKRKEIARNLATFLGISSNVKNITNNVQLNDNRRQVSLNGPVQIILEANNGEFNPEFGSCRVERPSAGDIASSSG